MLHCPHIDSEYLFCQSLPFYAQVVHDLLQIVSLRERLVEAVQLPHDNLALLFLPFELGVMLCQGSSVGMAVANVKMP